MSRGFFKWAQRFETLDLHDFVGFSESRQTIFTGHLRLLKQSYCSSQKSRSGFGKHLIEFTDFIYFLYDNRYSLSSPNLGPPPDNSLLSDLGHTRGHDVLMKHHPESWFIEIKVSLKKSTLGAESITVWSLVILFCFENKTNQNPW